MKYIKTNESYRDDKYKAILEVRKKYEHIMNDHLLQLIDNYEYKSYWNDNEFYHLKFIIPTDYNPTELKEQVESCIMRLEYNNMIMVEDFMIYTKLLNQHRSINVSKKEIYNDIISADLVEIDIEIREPK